jgi:ABC-type multidrug transport system ATPase subunit
MIQRIVAHNFRAFQGFELDLSGQSSVLLIGGNGSGKSSVWFCLSKLQQVARGGNRVEDVVRPEDFHFLETRDPLTLGLEVLIDGKLFDYHLVVEWPMGFRAPRVEEEYLRVDGQVVYKRKQNQVNLTDGPEFLLDWHVFALPLINERRGQTSISDMINYLNRLLILSPIPQRMHSHSDAPTSELFPDSSNYSSYLKAILQEQPELYSKLADFSRQFIPDFLSLQNRSVGEASHRLMVVFERKQATDSRRLVLDFQSISSGEKCLILAAHVIASASVGAHGVCFWDEPDNHLSIAQVGHMITALRKAAMLPGGSQFIATSHHPETIRAFSDESTIVLQRRSHFDPPRAKRLSDIPYQGDLIDALVLDGVLE